MPAYIAIVVALIAAVPAFVLGLLAFRLQVHIRKQETLAKAKESDAALEVREQEVRDKEQERYRLSVNALMDRYEADVTKAREAQVALLARVEVLETRVDQQRELIRRHEDTIADQARTIHALTKEGC